MGLSVRKIRALFKKEMKNLSKNKNIFMISILPLVICLIYTNIFTDTKPGEGMEKSEILFLCLGMNIILVSSFMIAMLIAEEKEKNTLRTLMLSGVTPVEFLTGKMLITFFVSEITNVAIFFIIDIDSKYLGIYLLVTTLIVFCMIGLGAVIGIISPNQMSTGVIGMPILMVLYMFPIFAMANESLRKIAKFLPNYALKLIMDDAMHNKGYGSDFFMNLSVIIGWIILSTAVFIFTFHKIGLDK